MAANTYGNTQLRLAGRISWHSGKCQKTIPASARVANLSRGRTSAVGQGVEASDDLFYEVVRRRGAGRQPDPYRPFRKPPGVNRLFFAADRPMADLAAREESLRFGDVERRQAIRA